MELYIKWKLSECAFNCKISVWMSGNHLRKHKNKRQNLFMQKKKKRRKMLFLF